ncbi:MAG: hypothetical protein SOZ52_06835, partial [Pyramidobacter sp.]|nr:hypothetical protein [Pyramidobacter sp.]
DIQGGGYVKNGGTTIVTGETHITMKSDASVSIGGDIFGGGLAVGEKGSLKTLAQTGDTHIDVYGGTVDGMVFGAGQSIANCGTVESVTGNTNVAIHGGVVKQAVLGGGKTREYAKSTAPASGVYTLTSKAGDTSVTIEGGEVGGVVGGGLAQIYRQKDTDEYTHIQAITSVEKASITISGGTVKSIKDGAKTEGSGTHRSIEVIDNDAAVIGGGVASGKNAQSNVAAVNIAISTAQIDGMVYGGGLSAVHHRDSLPKAQGGTTSVSGGVTIDISGGTMSKVYGGGAAVGQGTLAGGTSTVSGDTRVTVSGTAVTDDIQGGGYVSGGGSSIVKGSTYVTLETDATVDIGGDIFGGGFSQLGAVGLESKAETGDTHVEVKGGTVRGMVFGSGQAMNTFDTNKSVTGDTYVTISGGTVKQAVLGGGKTRQSVIQIKTDTTYTLTSEAGSTSVEVTGGEVGGVVGGGLAQVYYRNSEPTDTVTAVTSVKNATLILSGGIVNSIESGAESESTDENQRHRSVETIDTGAAVIGGGVAGGAQAQSIVSGDVSITLNGAEVKGDIIGGGVSSEHNRDGGTSAGNPRTHGGTTKVAGKVKINLNSGTVDGDVYGGGAAASETDGLTGGTSEVAGDVSITLAGASVTGDIYAGGHVIGKGTATVGGEVVISLDSGTVRNVYARGNGEGAELTAASPVKVLMNGAAVSGVLDGAQGCGSSAGSELTYTAGTFGTFKSFQTVNITGSLVSAEDIFAARSDGALNGGEKGAATAINIKDGGSLIAGTLKIEDGGTVTIGEGGVLMGGSAETPAAISLAMEEGGSLVLDGGTLHTDTAQTFNTAAQTDGVFASKADGVRDGITLTSGTLSLYDEKYTLAYSNSAAVSGITMMWMGTPVDESGDTVSEVHIDQIQQGVLAETTIIADADSSNTVTVSKDNVVGGQTLDIDGATGDVTLDVTKEALALDHLYYLIYLKF